MSLKLSELAEMDEQQREAALADLVREATAAPNGHQTNLDRRLRAFEMRYEMSSDDMVAGFKAGTVRDTADIAEWLMLVRARDRG